MRSLAAVGFALLLLPAALAKSAASTEDEPGWPPPPPEELRIDVLGPTTLYMHLLSIHDMPINTQEPAEFWSDEASYGGATTSTLSCVDHAGGGTNTGGFGNAYHTSRGHSSPSLVAYDVIENGMPRFHPDRGISYDAELNLSVPATLHWYLRASMSTSATAGPISSLAAPVVPNVVVQATIREGESVSIDDQAYDAGEVIAQGRTFPVTLSGVPGQEVQDMPGAAGSGKAQVEYVGDAGDGPVFRFAVPLTLETDAIARSTGFNVRIDTFLDVDACSDPQATGALMPNVVLPITAFGWRPYLELGVDNPLRLEYLVPQTVGKDLVMHASVTSLWGAYDVTNVRLNVTGPSPAGFALMHQGRSNLYRDQSVNLAWQWANGTRAASGHYVVELQATNLQGTATLMARTSFDIAPRPEMPGAPVGLVAAGLVALAVLRRR